MKTPEFLERLELVKQLHDGGWQARCPAHHDRTPSLTVSEGTEGILIKCWAGCEWYEILDAMGLQRNALFYDAGESWGQAAPTQPEGIWPYVDENGAFLFQVLKYRKHDGSKSFKQRRYAPTDEQADHMGWAWNLRGTKRVLYRLPELIHGVILPGGVVPYGTFRQSKWVYIVDGEKDADELRKQGRIATCGPGGASKWLPGYVKYFVNKHVIVVRDKDPAGEGWAQDVADSLEPGRITAALRVVEAKDGKDSYDSLLVNRIEEAFVAVV